jgi:branched-chain amino acid transport system substrate-binding protein
LTQEELAERAGLGWATINTLERGTRQTPRKETIALLAEALTLKECERVLLEGAAREHWRDLQSAFMTVSAAEPLAIDQAVEDGAPAVGAPSRVLRAPGKQIARLMSRKRVVGLASGLLVVLLVGVFFTVAPGRFQTGGRTLCLATEAPTSEDIGYYGKPLENAVNLAVMQHQNPGSGYTLKAITYDETPEDGVDQQDVPVPYVQNMLDSVRNPCVMGMVGPYKSYVARDEMPIAANAGLVVISPTNTNPALTLRPYAEAQGVNFDQLHPQGKPINYFSLAPTDATQAVADANVTVDLGARSVYLVNAFDTEYGSEYGELLVSEFTQTFEGKGGRIVGIDNIETDLSVIPALAARIAAAHPDAVFFGGVSTSGAGLLKEELVKHGYTGSLIGADGIADLSDFVADAGVKAANGVYGSIEWRDLSTFTSGAAATFIHDYAAWYPVQDLSPYAANAYDAAMVLITACKNLIRAGKDVTRATMIEQVQHMQYAGVIGPISFDPNGDITHSIFSIYTVQNGQWVYAWQVSV